MPDNDRVTAPIDVTLSAEYPFRGLSRALAPARPKVAAAVFFFFLKDSPNWVLPVITAAVVDTLVRGGDARELIALGAGAVLLITAN